VHGVAFDQDLAARIASDIGAQTVTAAGALVFALKTLGIRSFGFASPYVPAINDTAVTFLTSAGFDCVQRSEVAETLDNEGQGAMTPDDVLSLGRNADHPDAQAVVLSCTDMRAVEIIDTLEQELGKPVITSNQAMMAQARTKLGLKDPVTGFGRLLKDTRS
jgi:maleate cis-trans isomerase